MMSSIDVDKQLGALVDKSRSENRDGFRGWQRAFLSRWPVKAGAILAQPTSRELGIHRTVDVDDLHGVGIIFIK